MSRLDIGQMFEMAMRHHRGGQRAEAEALYRRIVAAEPNHADGWNLLGVLAFESGRNGQAVEFIRRAVELNSVHAGYRRNLGFVLAAAGDRNGALEACRAALALRPDDIPSIQKMGDVLQELGRSAEAIESYGTGLALQPDNPDLLNNRGIALQALGHMDQAINDFQRAISLRPDFPHAHNNLGNALLLQGKADDAILEIRRALELSPNFDQAYYNLGNALKHKEDLDDAAVAYRHALELRPGWRYANNLGTVLKDSGRLDEGLACYRQAISQSQRLAPGSEGASRAFGNLLYAIHFHPDYDAVRIRREHAVWYETCAKPRVPEIIQHENDPSPDRRLRIGYVSPDFRHHSQSFFTIPLLSHHDHNQFEIYCYSNVDRPDELTARIRSYADAWRDIQYLQPAEVADRVRGDRIDILIDLTLHMSRNRLLAFARKPAPIQVTWLGYPSTTGLETIDYRLSDPWLDPPESTNEDWYSEKTIRLPHTFWCYDPIWPTPDLIPPPSQQNGYITFGGLNGFYKVTPVTLDTWGRILHQTPGSRLVLLAPRGSARAAVVKMLAGHQVSADRIQFLDRMSRQDYIAAYQRIDISLDPIPCPGHTTTFDSLWLGVPVVTLAGPTAISRGGASILGNLGLSELVSRDVDQYVQLATSLAHDPHQLRELRSSLRDRMKSSPLMDAGRFTRDFEAILRAMWREWCDHSSR